MCMYAILKRIFDGTVLTMTHLEETLKWGVQVDTMIMGFDDTTFLKMEFSCLHTWFVSTGEATKKSCLAAPRAFDRSEVGLLEPIGKI